MTWRFEWITQSEKFLSKSFWASLLWKWTNRGIEEDEEAEWRHEIEFRKGIDFLGAIDKKLDENREEKENMNIVEGSGKKERKNYAW